MTLELNTQLRTRAALASGMMDQESAHSVVTGFKDGIGSYTCADRGSFAVWVFGHYIDIILYEYSINHAAD